MYMWDFFLMISDISACKTYIIKFIVSLIFHICLLCECMFDISQDCTFYFEMKISSSKPILRISKNRSTI